jgi:hypothetical protein
MRNVQDLIKLKWAGGRGQHRITNMNNIHTCTIGCPTLVIDVEALMHRELLKVTCDVIHSIRVQVPVRIGPIGGRRHGSNPVIRNKLLIEPVPTHIRRVSWLQVDLALWLILSTGHIHSGTMPEVGIRHALVQKCRG